MKPLPDTIALAASLPLEGGPSPDWVHLIPAPLGEVRTHDGRGPYRVGDAAQLLAASLRNPRGIFVDENHITDLHPGAPAPARGWIVELAERPDGIWGRVEWTEEGRRLVEGRAYRGISPVLSLDPADKREVRAILRASLTNLPNLGGLTALSAETRMDTHRLAEALGLAASATEDEIVAAVAALKGGAAPMALMAETAKALGLEGAEGQALVVGARAKVEALAALQAEVATLRGERDTLRTQLEGNARAAAEAWIDGEMGRGRAGLNAQTRGVYLELFMQDAPRARQIVEALPVLGGALVPSGKPPAGMPGAGEPSAEARGAALAAAAVAYQSEQAKAGREVAFLAALDHVAAKG